MADNETDVAPSGANPPSAEAHYAASRQPASTEAPKVVDGVPEQPEPKVEAEPEAKAESENDEKPADADDKSEEDQKQDNEDEPHRPKRRSWKQENIRLTRINRELREKLAAGPSGNQPPQQQAEPKTTEQATADAKRPKQEDYESYDAYLNAREEYQAARIKSEVTKEFEQKETAKRQSAEQAESVNKFKESADKAKAKYADFEESVWELGYTITPDIAQLIAATDDPGELAYHLSQNPDEAARIARLPLAKAAIELGKIEARMVPATPPAPPKALEKPKIPETKAPPPPKTVPQGTARPVRRLEELSQEDFYAKRKAQLRG